MLIDTGASLDRLVDLLAQMIWVVTCYHEIVGTIVDYTQYPDYLGYRLQRNRNIVDTESYLLGKYITGATGKRMPSLVGDFPNYFGNGINSLGPWEADVWDRFQQSIVQQGSEVQTRDKIRQVTPGMHEFLTMDPTKFECAISV